MIEPRITINGTVLSEAEAIAVRVALSSFATDLTEGLGDDEVLAKHFPTYLELWNGSTSQT